MKRTSVVVALAALALAAALPAAASSRVYVRLAPPAAVVELHETPPSARHVWIAGYYRWDDSAYVWVPGSWAIPPSHHHAWVAGHWAHTHRGYYWVNGHWR
jgi:hypothetical protein